MSQRPDPMRASGILVSLRWPIRDAGEAAAVIAPILGTHATDVAAALRRCQGFWDAGVDLQATDAIAQALRAAGLAWYALSAAVVPRPPKPLVARGLDPRPNDVLLAPVSMTGPPEAIPHAAVLAAVPVIWQSSSTRAGPVGPAKGSSAASVAVSLATTGGLNLLMKRPGGGGGETREVVTEGRAMLALVLLRGPGQWQRIHVFADRCDYRVLTDLTHDSGRNWRALLAQVTRRIHLQQAGAAMLAQAVDGGEGPAPPLIADDDNVLADRLRWLLMTAMLRRMGASEG